jgi:hypothetical protein
MQIALIIGAIVLTALLGLSKIARGLGNLTEKKSLCSEFMQTFRRFVDSVGEDREAFGWLLHRSHRMQELVASQGNFAIKRPFASSSQSGYLIITNGLQETEMYLRDRDLQRQGLDMAGMMDNAMVRQLGILDDEIEVDAAAIKNPMTWFREGVGTLVRAPLTVLEYFNILTPAFVANIEGSRIFKVLTGIAALLTLIGGIFGSFTDILSKIKPLIGP